MNLSLPERLLTNHELGREVACFAEHCAAFGAPPSELSEVWHYWRSRYLRRHTPDLPGRLLGRSPGLLHTPGVFLSLSDRAAAVAMRLVSTMAEIPFRRILNGLTDTEFVVFTTAVSGFQSSTFRIQQVDPIAWPTTALRIVESLRPPWLLVDGIGFGRGLRTSQLARAARVMEVAAKCQCRLLLFD